MTDRIPVPALDPGSGSDGDGIVISGGKFTVGPLPGGGGSLTVQDENGNVSTSVTQIDFQGAGVTATSGTGEVIVTIPGGGSSAPTTPTVVASAMAFVSSSSTGTITLPAGIAANDTLLIFTGHGFRTNSLSAGWMQLVEQNGTGAGGAVYYRKADGTESGTTVTVTFGGSYYGEIGAVVVRGVSAFRDVKMNQASSGTSLTLPGMFGVRASDLYLTFGMARVSNTTVTSSVGTLVVGRSTDANAGGAIYAYTAPGGPQNAVMTSSGSSSGFVVAAVALGG